MQVVFLKVESSEGYTISNVRLKTPKCDILRNSLSLVEVLTNFNNFVFFLAGTLLLEVQMPL